jgi:hypothetical protein
MAAKLTGIYVICAHPERAQSYGLGEPAATLGAWYFPAEPSDTLEQIVARHHAQFPLGAKLIAVEDSKVSGYQIEPQLSAVDPATLIPLPPTG